MLLPSVAVVLATLVLREDAALFRVRFSEAVTGFTTADLTLSGTAGATTAVITPVGTGNSTFDVSVSGMTQSGTVVLTVATGAAVDAAGNPSQAAVYVDNSVQFNQPQPVRLFTTGVFTANNTGFHLADVNADGAGQNSFIYGPNLPGRLPIAGDADGDGVDTVGVFDPRTATFYLVNENSATPGPVNVFSYRTNLSGWWPIAGDWDGPAASLVAAGVPTGPSSAAPLSLEQLQAIADEAIRRWLDAGISASQAERLAGVKLAVADLPGSELGRAEGNRVTVDLDAAGFGWFVDRTPGDDAEFAPGVSGLTALDPLAVDRVDLLSAVAHEFGHILGLEDVAEGTVMASKLQSGLRRVPVDLAFAEGGPVGRGQGAGGREQRAKSREQRARSGALGNKGPRQSALGRGSEHVGSQHLASPHAFHFVPLGKRLAISCGVAKRRLTCWPDLSPVFLRAGEEKWPCLATCILLRDRYAKSTPKPKAQKNCHSSHGGGVRQGVLDAVEELYGVWLHRATGR